MSEEEQICAKCQPRAVKLSMECRAMGYDQGIADFRRSLVAACETWCGMDAYEHGYDKPCDEHSCDNARGRQCSADELLDFIKQWEPGEK